MTQKGEGDTPGAIWYFNHAIRQYSLIAQLPCQQSQKCQTYRAEQTINVRQSQMQQDAVNMRISNEALETMWYQMSAEQMTIWRTV